MLQFLPQEQAFLEPGRPDTQRPQDARCVVVPFGLEASVSYGGGTARGPQAILAASHQLELFDEELWREPCADFGVATLDVPPLPAAMDEALALLQQITGDIVRQDKFPMTLGGEHSLTPAALAPLAARYDDLVVLQFDAHADLRDSYLGTPNSHACAMRRVLDIPHIELVAVGVRAISAGEIPFLEDNRQRIHMHFAKDQAQWDLETMMAPLRGRHVYISFDIDGLDSAIMPATGTPEPGGLSFWQSCQIMKHAASIATIVGADVVELAPIAGMHGWDFTAAKLAYKIMSYALSGTGPRSGVPRSGVPRSGAPR